MNRRRNSLKLIVAAALAASLLSTTACSRGQDAQPDDSSDSDSTTAAGAPTDKYVPETEEGLGASIAIVIDNSGSMKDEAAGDSRPKYVVAREALEAMLASTDSFVLRQPDFPINVGLYRFSNRVTPMPPVARYDRSR